MPRPGPRKYDPLRDYLAGLPVEVWVRWKEREMMGRAALERDPQAAGADAAGAEP